MNSRREYRFSNDNPLSTLAGILVAVLLFMGLFYLVGFIFRILWFLLPAILVAVAIIDYRVITGYVKWVFSLFQRNWIVGLAAALLTVVGAPVVGLLLLGRALFRRRVKDAQAEYERQTKGELVDYEEVDSETLDLPDLDRPRTQRDGATDDDYDELFK